MQRFLVAPCMALVLLAACATTSYVGNEASPFFAVPRDSRLLLTQALTIPPEEVSVFVQDGRLMPFPEVKKYYPHCKFEVFTRGPAPRTVAPDEFVVTRTVQEETTSADAGRIQIARAPLRVMADNDRGGSPLLAFTTRLYLKSANQPDVFRLSCAQWGYLPLDRHVTIAEMRHALGGLMTLTLAGQ